MTGYDFRLAPDGTMEPTSDYGWTLYGAIMIPNPQGEDVSALDCYPGSVLVRWTRPQDNAALTDVDYMELATAIKRAFDLLTVAEAMAEAIMNHDWGIAEPGELRTALDRWQELSPLDPTPGPPPT